MKADDKFVHICRRGTEFRGQMNLQGGVEVRPMPHASEQDILHDTAQMFGWHGVQIWPTLSGSGLGFAGYDCVTLNVIRE